MGTYFDLIVITETFWEDPIDWNVKINAYNLRRNNQMWGRKEKGEAIYQRIYCLFENVYNQRNILSNINGLIYFSKIQVYRSATNSG